MDAAARDLLERLAAKYVWWKTPQDALLTPDRIVRRMMQLGAYADVQDMVAALGDEHLRGVLRRAEVGELDARSWTYWHYRLRLAEPGSVPPLPTRRTA